MRTRRGWNPPEIPEGTQCSYCDGPADCWDHIIPWSYRAGGPITPACTRCNGILSNKMFNTFAARKRYVRAKLKSRVRNPRTQIKRRIRPLPMKGGADKPVPDTRQVGICANADCGIEYRMRRFDQRYCTSRCYTADARRRRRELENVSNT